MDHLKIPLLVLLLAGCTKAPEGAVCGLHAASEPVKVKGKVLSVGARLMADEELDADGWALLECFGGALKVLDDEKVRVGDLKESKIQATTIPRRALHDGKLVDDERLPPSMSLRYSDNRFTPESALKSNDSTSGDYFRAFFTPNGIENMGSGPRPEGPTSLPPPSQRARISRIHAGSLGEGGPTLKVTDDVVFAETSDHATAALLEDETYSLGETIRLVLPDGAEATLHTADHTLELDGPLDLRL